MSDPDSQQKHLWHLVLLPRAAVTYCLLAIHSHSKISESYSKIWFIHSSDQSDRLESEQSQDGSQPVRITGGLNNVDISILTVSYRCSVQASVVEW